MKKTASIIFLGIAVAVVAGVTPLKWKSTTINLGEVSANKAQVLNTISTFVSQL